MNVFVFFHTFTEQPLYVIAGHSKCLSVCLYYIYILWLRVATVTKTADLIPNESWEEKEGGKRVFFWKISTLVEASGLDLQTFLAHKTEL